MYFNGLKLFGGFLFFSFVFLFLVNQSVGDNEINQTTKDFMKFRTTHPTLYHGRTRREISTTRNATGGHLPSVRLAVLTSGGRLELDLELNVDLVPADHALLYQEGGRTITHKPTKEELDLCHYRGSVRGKPDSWAAVSTCRGVSGLIFDGNKTLYIEPVEGSDIGAEHYLFEQADLHTTHSCGNEEHDDKVDPGLPTRGQNSFSRASRYSRYIPGDYAQILDAYNVDSTPRYVELLLVADYSMYVSSGSDVRAVQAFMVRLVNIANTIYAPLNIKIALTRVIVWNEGDGIPVDQNSDVTLENFAYYRQTSLAEIPHDHAQLLTGQGFFNNILGKAFIGAICGARSVSVASFALFRTTPDRVAITLAHELGHSLGMQHDKPYYCQCPDTSCVMSPTDQGYSNNQWSSCSRNAVIQLFRSGEDQCLFNRPVRM